MPTENELDQLQREEGESNVAIGNPVEHFKPKPGLLLRSIPSLILPLIVIGAIMLGILLTFSGMVSKQWEPMALGIMLLFVVPYFVGELG